MNREEWLNRAVQALKPLLERAGTPLTNPVSVSCGFSSTGKRSNRIGECWPRSRCATGTNQIFISPTLDDSLAVIDTLLHELIHAVDDCKHSHGKEFKKIAVAVGMEGPMRSCSAGDKLKTELNVLIEKLGPYPHGALRVSQVTQERAPRPKARCDKCGFEVPMIKKYLSWGPPLCPKHLTLMLPIGEWMT